MHLFGLIMGEEREVCHRTSWSVLTLLSNVDREFIDYKTSMITDNAKTPCRDVDQIRNSFLNLTTLAKVNFDRFVNFWRQLQNVQERLQERPSKHRTLNPLVEEAEAKAWHLDPSKVGRWHFFSSDLGDGRQSGTFGGGGSRRLRWARHRSTCCARRACCRRESCQSGFLSRSSHRVRRGSGVVSWRGVAGSCAPRE